MSSTSWTRDQKHGRLTPRRPDHAHGLVRHGVLRPAFRTVVMQVEWRDIGGDLDDDCVAEWCGLLLRAEWMNDDRWWWAVTDLGQDEEIDSSNYPEYQDIKFNSADAARRAAEWAAQSYRERNPWQRDPAVE
jgi:hypothetical protein